jgi:hypothetical protein
MLRVVIIGFGVVMAQCAFAQSVNLFFGPEGATPPDAGHGAAGPAGVWNRVNAAEPTTLVGLDGSPTGVQNFATGWGMPASTPPAGPVGNDALMLSWSYQFIDVAAPVTITGLQNGRYNAIFYGLNLGARSTLILAGDDGEFFTGPWTGQHQQGVSYVTLPFTVTNGTMTFSVVGSIVGPANLSAIQIVQVSGPGCTADANGDGDFGTDADIEAFFACLAGSCCARCSPSDFNGDGDSGTDADIESFFRVLAGHPC